MVQGWLIAVLCIITLILFMLTNIHPFLAINAPIQAEVLVVEGWIPDYALKKAITEFERGNYKKLITTGMPLHHGFYLSDYKNFADLAAATFIALGVEKDKIVAVPALNVRVNRTAASAKALHHWLSTSDLSLNSINLYSYDVHTRRSWLTFKQVLAPTIKVGAIAIPSAEYDPQRWWRYSAGVRSIISETIAYLYARFIDPIG